MLVLHHAWRSSASRRVRLCLAERLKKVPGKERQDKRIDEEIAIQARIGPFTSSIEVSHHEPPSGAARHLPPQTGEGMRVFTFPRLRGKVARSAGRGAEDMSARDARGPEEFEPVDKAARAEPFWAMDRESPPTKGR